MKNWRKKAPLKKTGNRHFKHFKGGYRQSGTRAKILKMKPGADTTLKKVFATIGVPDKKPFTLDRFQIKALNAIESGDCLVTAPTGAGKTWVAIKAVARIFENGGRAWYASPLKALTNAKYTEFSAVFGDSNLGILTGDRRENPDAPIIIGTTEILRNQLYDAMHRGEILETDFVVLDEAHFLGDEDRGVVWEEIMIYLPSRIPLLMLSATIGNAHQIAAWLAQIRKKKCHIVAEKKRPVPLQPLFLHPSGTILPLVTPHSHNRKKTRLHKKVQAYLNMPKPPLLALPHKLPQFGKILRVLDKYNLLPAIFFLKSRADCDNALDLCTSKMRRDPTHHTNLNKRIDALTAGDAYLDKHRQLRYLAKNAVGAHHSGQLPAWKLVLETLMQEGLLKAIFATSTVAAGVNFPARTIVLSNSDRFNGRDFLPLTSTEFHQTTGRAGRRGMDQIGFAIVLPGKYMDIRLMAELSTAPPSAIFSQIKINFSMVLNLLLSHTPDQITDLLAHSFAAFLMMRNRHSTVSKKKSAETRQYLENDFRRHLNFLRATYFVTDDGILTDDGRWTSQLRVDQPLMIAEGFRRRLFPESDPVLLSAIIAAFVNEREMNSQFEQGHLPENLEDAFYKIKRNLRPFVQKMYKQGFAIRVLYMRPAAAMYAWASGQSWEETLAIAEMAEGDLAMLIFRSADNLRHIQALAHVFPEAAATAKQAVKLILKYPVVMDYDNNEE
ncbi:DEAD/DEAH box helicase [Desulfococcaceae bacterium HSG7]|nr:DEAD/DEAH box helicase [Desulfococcaceae bacterium HSG7]